jgi:hypothetical protein
MVAGSLALVTAVAVLFGAWEQVSGPAFAFTALEIVWEGFLGICCRPRTSAANVQLRDPLPGVREDRDSFARARHYGTVSHRGSTQVAYWALANC